VLKSIKSLKSLGNTCCWFVIPYSHFGLLKPLIRSPQSTCIVSSNHLSGLPKPPTLSELISPSSRSEVALCWRGNSYGLPPQIEGCSPESEPPSASMSGMLNTRSGNDFRCLPDAGSSPRDNLFSRHGRRLPPKVSAPFEACHWVKRQPAAAVREAKQQTRGSNRRSNADEMGTRTGLSVDATGATALSKQHQHGTLYTLMGGPPHRESRGLKEGSPNHMLSSPGGPIPISLSKKVHREKASTGLNGYILSSTVASLQSASAFADS
jgi:hypothetical protein